MKFLIVDDSPNSIYLMAHYLLKHGHEVISSLNAEEGIQKAMEEEPDLIVCDIRMPGIGGIEFAKEIKSYPELMDTPLVAVSALYREIDKKNALDAGFDGYLIKPIDAETLISKLLEYV